MRHYAIYLYDEPRCEALSARRITDYLRDQLGAPVELRADVFAHWWSLGTATEDDAAQLAERIARAKVRNPAGALSQPRMLPGEIEFELRRLKDTDVHAFGYLYDGPKLAAAYSDLIVPDEAEDLHIVFTNQLVGTWDPGDRRYHARTIVCSFPVLISTTGLVEAPARPREYYLLRQQYASLGMSNAAEIDLGPQMAECCLFHDDPKLTEVAKGYALQAAFYYLTGDPFCPDPGCRLFNAHWQTEMLYAQLKSPYELCPAHEKALAALKDQACAME
jgi:hypothetical protein